MLGDYRAEFICDYKNRYNILRNPCTIKVYSNSSNEVVGQMMASAGLEDEIVYIYFPHIKGSVQYDSDDDSPDKCPFEVNVTIIGAKKRLFIHGVGMYRW